MHIRDDKNVAIVRARPKFGLGTKKCVWLDGRARKYGESFVAFFFGSESSVRMVSISQDYYNGISWVHKASHSRSMFVFE